jgi:hypothetical protein
MGVFDDKRYDQLDWVSQAVQPIETPLAALLDRLPESTKIDFELITCNHPNGELDRETIISSMIRKFHPGYSMSWKEKDLINECFEFDIRSPELIVNLENRTLTGEVYLVKTKFSIEEDKLKSVLGEHGREEIGKLHSHRMDHTRTNEMLDLLEDCEVAIASRSGKTKKLALNDRLRQIFTNNEWKIKSTDLADKIGFWIKAYIDNGDLAALSNISRLKVMTYKEAPIYSIEETT